MASMKETQGDPNNLLAVLEPYFWQLENVALTIITYLLTFLVGNFHSRM